MKINCGDLLLQLQLSQHFSKELVENIASVLASQEFLDEQGDAKQYDACGTAVDYKYRKACAADEFACHMVKAKGCAYHDAEGYQGAEHVQQRVLHAVGAVLAGPHEDHGNHLQKGSGGAYDRHALDAEGFREQDVGGDGGRKDSRVQEGGQPHAFCGVKASY